MPRTFGIHYNHHIAAGKGRLAIQGRPGEGTEAAAPKKILAPPVSVYGATHHRNRGRQGAVDKKRGRNPVKETASTPARRTVFPPQIKNPNSLRGELRIAPVLLGPQVGGRPVSRGPCPSILQAGLLALGSIYSRRLPGASFTPVASAGFVPNYSGGTATDSHRLPFYL